MDTEAIIEPRSQVEFAADLAVSEYDRFSEQSGKSWRPCEPVTGLATVRAFGLVRCLPASSRHSARVVRFIAASSLVRRWSWGWRFIDGYVAVAGFPGKGVCLGSRSGKYRCRTSIPIIFESGYQSASERWMSCYGRGTPFFVHCSAGVNRSPSTVIAYLHWVLDWEFDRAFDHVIGCRSCDPYVEAIKLASGDWSRRPTDGDSG